MVLFLCWTQGWVRFCACSCFPTLFFFSFFQTFFPPAAFLHKHECKCLHYPPNAGHFNSSVKGFTWTWRTDCFLLKIGLRYYPTTNIIQTNLRCGNESYSDQSYDEEMSGIQTNPKMWK